MTAKARSNPAPATLAFNLRMIMFWQRERQLRYAKEEMIMALNICWMNDLTKAKEAARQTKKPVLLDFFNPQ